MTDPVQPVTRGDFVYRNIFFVDVGNQNLHPRASVAELTALLRPDLGSASSSAAKDQVGHWYEAQLVHYGLPRSKVKNTAKMRLLQALNEGKLGVPAELVRQEAQMKKEYLAAKRKDKTLAKGKKRKQPDEESALGPKNVKAKVAKTELKDSAQPKKARASDKQAAGRGNKHSGPSRSTLLGSANAAPPPSAPAIAGVRKKQTARRSTHPFQMSRSDQVEYESRRSTSPIATNRKQTATRGAISSRASHRRSPSPDEGPTVPQKDTDGKPPRKRKQQSSSDPAQYAEDLSLRLCQDGTKIWGEFCTGINQGILLVDPAPARLRTGVTVGFDWRAIETGTGENLSDTGDMVFTSANEVNLCFYGMCEQVEFSGKKVSDVCGRQPWAFRSEWDDLTDWTDADYSRSRGWG
ncbi:hypothetical protein LTR66_004613 [Elasticomyces elasticus]|nr:hypothetical protein LTR66_004613 [Elasticomyces elasticus]